jgi:hypothetical protein
MRVVRGMLGQVQHLGAVREERRTAFTQVEAASIELRERGDEMGRCPAFALCEPCHFREQVAIGEIVEGAHRLRHASFVARQFLQRDVGLD